MTNKTQVKMPSDQGGGYYDYRDQTTRPRRMYYEGLIDYQRIERMYCVTTEEKRTLELSLQEN